MNRTTFNAMLAQYARKTVTGTGGVSWLDGIHCEIPRIVVRGAETQKRYSGKNLFDISKVEPTPPTSIATIRAVGENSITVYVPPGVEGSGATTFKTLKTLAPALTVGETYVLSLETTAPDKAYIYLNTAKKSWEVGRSMTITEEMLESNVYFYGQATGDSDEAATTVVSNIQIEAGTAATDYEPYTGGAPAPNPGYPILPQFAGAVTLTDAAGGTVTIPELLAIPGATVCDTAEYIGGESWRITRRVRAIDSYAGEAVGDVWCSSTGELSEGAAVWYELETPTVETLTLGRLVQPKGAGGIEQTTGDLKCEIAVEYVGHS